MTQEGQPTAVVIPFSQVRLEPTPYSVDRRFDLTPAAADRVAWDVFYRREESEGWVWLQGLLHRLRAGGRHAHAVDKANRLALMRAFDRAEAAAARMQIEARNG